MLLSGYQKSRNFITDYENKVYEYMCDYVCMRIMYTHIFTQHFTFLFLKGQSRLAYKMASYTFPHLYCLPFEFGEHFLL
jgi:hypothetical protein